MYNRTFVLFLFFVLYTFIIIFAIMSEKDRVGNMKGYEYMDNIQKETFYNKVIELFQNAKKKKIIIKYLPVNTKQYFQVKKNCTNFE